MLNLHRSHLRAARITSLTLVLTMLSLSAPGRIARSFESNHRASRISSAAPTHGETKAASLPAIDESKRAQMSAAYGRLPLSFEVNEGQTDKRVKFLARGAGYSLFLTGKESVLSLRKSSAQDESKAADIRIYNSGSGIRGHRRGSPIDMELSRYISQDAKHEKDAPKHGDDAPQLESSAVVQMNLVGANDAPQVTGEDVQIGKSNYFIGNDATNWRRNVAHFGKVRYRNVYRGIDQLFYGNQGQLEYDFVVAPNADYKQIALAFSGVKSFRLDAASGDLILVTTDGGEIKQHKPTIYQEENGIRREIPGNYALRQTPNTKFQTSDSLIRFEIGEYDQTKPLVIDPTLVYSTYLGGSGDDEIRNVTLDTNGNLYAVGLSSSVNFPVQSSLQGLNAGSFDAVILKLNPAGNQLLFSTYIGGSGDDYGHGIALDKSGNIYIGGETTSSNFPLQNALQTTNNGNTDAFAIKLNSSGSQIIYSTFIGGGNADVIQGIAVDANGSFYATGFTFSNNFPLQNALQNTLGGQDDAFVLKLNAVGNQLIYSTLLGGNDFDGGDGIALDGQGNTYISGFALSTNFPVRNALQGTKGGGQQDAFIAKINDVTPPPATFTISGQVKDTCDGIRRIYPTGMIRGISFGLGNSIHLMAITSALRWSGRSSSRLNIANGSANPEHLSNEKMF